MTKKYLLQRARQVIKKLLSILKEDGYDWDDEAMGVLGLIDEKLKEK